MLHASSWIFYFPCNEQNLHSVRSGKLSETFKFILGHSYGFVENRIEDKTNSENLVKEVYSVLNRQRWKIMI